MKARLSSGMWLAVISVACSASDGGELFEGPATSGNGGTSTTGSSSTVTATSSNTSASASSSDTAGGSGGMGGGSGGMDSTASSAGGAITGTTSRGNAETTGTSSTSVTSGTSAGGASSSAESSTGGASGTGGQSSTDGSTDPTEVVLEYETDRDCVELQCPEEAPHLVACDITFSSFNDEYACLALEEESLVFVKSGDSCEGSVINAGSTITCSSEPLDSEISDSECITNKEQLEVVSDRCDCEAASEIDEC